MSHSERWFISAPISPDGHFLDFDSEVNHRDIDGKLQKVRRTVMNRLATVSSDSSHVEAR